MLFSASSVPAWWNGPVLTSVANTKSVCAYRSLEQQGTRVRRKWVSMVVSSDCLSVSLTTEQLPYHSDKNRDDNDDDGEGGTTTTMQKDGGDDDACVLASSLAKVAAAAAASSERESTKKSAFGGGSTAAVEQFRCFHGESIVAALGLKNQDAASPVVASDASLVSIGPTGSTYYAPTCALLLSQKDGRQVLLILTPYDAPTERRKAAVDDAMRRNAVVPDGGADIDDDPLYAAAKRKLNKKRLQVPYAESAFYYCRLVRLVESASSFVFPLVMYDGSRVLAFGGASTCAAVVDNYSDAAESNTQTATLPFEVTGTAHLVAGASLHGQAVFSRTHHVNAGRTLGRFLLVSENGSYFVVQLSTGGNAGGVGDGAVSRAADDGGAGFSPRENMNEGPSGDLDVTFEVVLSGYLGASSLPGEGGGGGEHPKPTRDDSNWTASREQTRHQAPPPGPTTIRSSQFQSSHHMPHASIAGTPGGTSAHHRFVFAPRGGGSGHNKVICIASPNDAVAFLCSSGTGVGYFASLVAPDDDGNTMNRLPPSPLIVATSLPRSVFVHTAVWHPTEGAVALISEVPAEKDNSRSREAVEGASARRSTKASAAAWQIYLVKPDDAASGCDPTLCRHVTGLAATLVDCRSKGLADVLLPQVETCRVDCRSLPLFRGTQIALSPEGREVEFLVRVSSTGEDYNLVRLALPDFPQSIVAAGCTSSVDGLALRLLAAGLSQWDDSTQSRRLEQAWASAMSAARTSLLSQEAFALGECSGTDVVVGQPDTWLLTWCKAYARLLQDAPQYMSSIGTVAARERDASHLRSAVRELVRQGQASLLVELLCTVSHGSRLCSIAVRELYQPLCDEAYCLVNRLPTLGDCLLPCCSDEFRSLITSAFAIISASTTTTKSGGASGGAAAINNSNSASPSIRSFDDVANFLSGSPQALAEGIHKLTLADVRLHATRVLMRSGPLAAQKCLDVFIRTPGCANEIKALHDQYGVLATHVAMATP